MKIKNKNTNNNIILLDFGEYDISKKKKKKPKKKRVDKKKIAVEELKTTLQQFDELLDQAKNNNVKIPEELGELPVNIEDINTIKELNELTADLNQRIINIRELIENKEPVIPEVQRIDPMQFGANGFLQGQAIQPIILQRQQEGLRTPQRISQSTETESTSTEPSAPSAPSAPAAPADSQKPVDNNLEKIKEQLQKQEEEIIARLPEDQQEDAKKKLDEIKKQKIEEIKKKSQTPQTPEQEKESAKKMENEDLVKPTLKDGFQIIKPEDINDSKILGKSFEAPIGLYDRWETVKGFIERNQKTGKEDEELPNKVNIDIADFEAFKVDQKQNLNAYKDFVKKLNQEQKKSIDGQMDIPTLINKEILNVLQTNPKKVLEQIYTGKFKRNIKLNITGIPEKVDADPIPEKPVGSKPQKGKQVQETPGTLEAIKILKDMKEKLKARTSKDRAATFNKFQKKEMLIILDKLEEASKLNNSYDEALNNKTPIIIMSEYGGDTRKEYRLSLIKRIISQYSKVTGNGTYTFFMNRSEERKDVASLPRPKPKQVVKVSADQGVEKQKEPQMKVDIKSNIPIKTVGTGVDEPATPPIPRGVVENDEGHRVDTSQLPRI